MFLLLTLVQLLSAQEKIYLDKSAGDMERYAAAELQRYIYQLSGKVLSISDEIPGASATGFVLATAKTSKNIEEKLQQRLSDKIGEEGYILEKQNNLLYIAATTQLGCLYGVYGLLGDHYGIGFYLGHDVVPFPKQKFYLPDVSEVKNPAVAIRGFLPWTNFPQSATVYSWEDWKFIIDQAAKMRMNFINIHNYNGEAGHNEMFHNFSLNGYISRVWMPTANTGHGWSCKGFDVKNFRFGAREIFDDYDFGADCALHNETLSNEMVFRKGVSLFQRVINYAHTRGVKMALGLDIDLILPEYKRQADDPAIIEARMQQVISDYPQLDYLILYISELIVNKPEKLELWKRTFEAMYGYLKKNNKSIRIAVSGWGLSKEIAAALPADVIAAPISAYSDGCEDGSIYGQREYWGCPWMERDFFSSQYYYPFGMDISNTIKAWQNRAANMKGFYTLTWRLTDAIDPKIAFIAQAPWDDKNRFHNSYEVYHDYALKNYGSKAAGKISAIINQNETYSCNDAECQPTGVFSGKPIEQSSYLLNIHKLEWKRKNNIILSIPAYHYDKIYKAGIEKRVDADSCVAFVEDGSYISFRQLQFGEGADSFTFYAATSYPYSLMEIRIGSSNGKLLSAIEVSNTGGMHNWKPHTVSIPVISGAQDVFICFKAGVRQQDEISKANAQIKLIDELIYTEHNNDNRRRMRYLQARLAAARDHLLLNKNFPLVTNAAQLPGEFSSWVNNFLLRVTDISSLGNVQSVQNRYVQERYLAKERELLNRASVKFPTGIEAKGTNDGTIISWQNNELQVKGFNVYANGRKLNRLLLSPSSTKFYHKANGNFIYQLTAVNKNDEESDRSPYASCFAGEADHKGPEILLVSPPSSLKKGNRFSIKLRLLDNRLSTQLSAFVQYRRIGETKWISMPMINKVRAVFAVDISLPGAGAYEYYVVAADGKNKTRYPAQGGNNLSFVVEEKEICRPLVLNNLMVVNDTIRWQRSLSKEISFIKIYRSRQKNFRPGTASFVCYLPSAAGEFVDNRFDFNGMPMKGAYYYFVSAVNADDQETIQHARLKIHYR